MNAPPEYGNRLPDLNHKAGYGPGVTIFVGVSNSLPYSIDMLISCVVLGPLQFLSLWQRDRNRMDSYLVVMVDVTESHIASSARVPS